MGMGFQFEQHRLGLWDLSWDLKKTISWEMGLGTPLHDPLARVDFLPQLCWLHFSVPFIGLERLDFLVPAYA